MKKTEKVAKGRKAKDNVRLAEPDRVEVQPVVETQAAEKIDPFPEWAAELIGRVMKSAG